MKELLAVTIGAIFVNNFVLTKFLGLRSFITITQKLENVVFMGIITTLILTVSNFMTFITYNYLIKPFNLDFLRIIVFLIIILFTVQLFVLIIKSFLTKIDESFKILYPLITTNCAILGISLLGISGSLSLTGSLIFGFSSGLGYFFVLFIISTILDKLESSDIPPAFKGVPIAFLTAGIMALAFSSIDKTFLEFLK